MAAERVWWLQYVPRSRVRTYELLGWRAEAAAPSLHDAFKVLMRHDGPGEPPVPAGWPRVARARGVPGRQG